MPLETYLFNPPFMFLPIEWIKYEKVKLGLRIVHSVLKAVFAYAVNGWQSTTHPFVVLSTWTPYLFLNPSDPICSEYKEYFEHRETMESIGAGIVERIATRHSIWSIVSGTVRWEDHEAAHLIPCAYVTMDVTPSTRFKEAHGIHQWWRQDLEFNYNLYQYN